MDRNRRRAWAAVAFLRLVLEFLDDAGEAAFGRDACNRLLPFGARVTPALPPPETAHKAARPLTGAVPRRRAAPVHKRRQTVCRRAAGLRPPGKVPPALLAPTCDPARRPVLLPQDVTPRGTARPFAASAPTARAVKRRRRPDRQTTPIRVRATSNRRPLAKRALRRTRQPLWATTAGRRKVDAKKVGIRHKDKPATAKRAVASENAVRPCRALARAAGRAKPLRRRPKKTKIVAQVCRTVGSGLPLPSRRRVTA